uniref:Peptidase_M28 domain-containing protein n=1 Tax=Meloidogyne hapla TaxID=6305 RepID=A0A1I8BDU8_MELHA
MEMFNGTRIIESLKWISSKMHVAGTEEQLNLMDTLAEKIHVWNDQNFRWELISSGVGRLPLNTVMEDELREQLENDPRINLWWNAYSHNGTAISDLVYANYGTKEDFELLNKSNISISGKIVLIRYGVIFRGDKIFNAEKRGAIGVILYSDPIDYVLGNEARSQRGALYRGMGDPETPLLPSLDYVHREFNEKQLRSKGMLPNIPVTSIGYHDAQRIFERMNGEPAIWSRWSGALQVTYRLTGTNLFRMDVKTQNVHRPIKNFIAKIEGAEEPDRWVLLGNHADAWSKGSIDPGTGTSIMLEIARVLSVYSKETGWRPRRTIIFCQWDAEEFGLIGSIEWVEQYLHQLKQRAVAYINLDNFNGNTTLNIKIKQPSESEINNGRYTLYDSWRFHNTRSTLNGDRSLPFIQLPHSGSDFQAFISFAGIPVADIRMENVPYSFMLYHTAFEVPWLNENFLDPKGLTSIALGQFWLEIVRQLADNIAVNNAKISISLIKREQINQRLISLEKCFLITNIEKNDENEENRQLRHSIFSAPMEEENSGYALPFLFDSIIKWKRAINSNYQIKAKLELHQISLSISWIQYGIECAQDLLRIEIND